MNMTESGIGKMTLLGHRSDRLHVFQPPQTVFSNEGKKRE
jgi:hypothetical protein